MDGISWDHQSGTCLINVHIFTVINTNLLAIGSWLQWLKNPSQTILSSQIWSKKIVEAALPEVGIGLYRFIPILSPQKNPILSPLMVKSPV
jgi:hypothetical protein